MRTLQERRDSVQLRIAELRDALREAETRAAQLTDELERADTMPAPPPPLDSDPIPVYVELDACMRRGRAERRVPSVRWGFD
jgi:hypothetical protein